MHKLVRQRPEQLRILRDRVLEADLVEDELDLARVGVPGGSPDESAHPEVELTAWERWSEGSDVLVCPVS